MVKIIAFAGSARKASLNRKLLAIAVRGAREAGAEVDHIDLADFEMPLYCGDLEEEKGIPENAQKLRERMIAADALMIASPEYNSSITPLLKNTLDWVSRPDGEVAALAAFTGKKAVLMAASPGYWGGLRGLVTLRALLGNIGVTVMPEQVTLPKAHEAFGEDGNLRKAVKQETLLNLTAVLLSV